MTLISGPGSVISISKACHGIAKTLAYWSPNFTKMMNDEEDDIT